MGLGLLVMAAISLLNGMALLVSYISNNAFPQPLSEQDEAKYLQAMGTGDREARNILIEHNLRLVAHITKKFDSTGNDSDDLISIGTIGLIKAINTYDRNKGTKLATYAARCIENEILMHLRSIRKIRGEVSLYDPIGVDKEGNESGSAGYLRKGLNQQIYIKGKVVKLGGFILPENRFFQNAL